MKKIIMSGMVMVATLVSLGGCFPGYPVNGGDGSYDRDDRNEIYGNDGIYGFGNDGVYERDGRYERGERHDRDERNDGDERHDRDGGHVEGERYDHDRDGGHDERK
ncbi:MAG: hypothetical protein NTY00_06020 [Deltaproteobacteria bacterium]|nr:hypothetical protein [Deltaproteobacteria bacterium]